MSTVRTVCLHCGKSVRLNKVGDETGLSCPECGGFIPHAFLESNKKYVDVDAASKEYSVAQEYFRKGEYFSAEASFARVCEIDDENYFAEYFKLLCSILAEKSEGRICGAELIMSLIDVPAPKLEVSNHTDEVKEMFILQSFKQVFDLLKELFETIGIIYAYDVSLRDKEYMIFAKHVSRITSVSVPDCGEINEVCAQICDLGLCSLYKLLQVTTANGVLIFPAHGVIKECRLMYANYARYLREVYPKYESEALKRFAMVYCDYTSAIAKKIKNYYENSANFERKFIITDTDFLSRILYDVEGCYKFACYLLFEVPGDIPEPVRSNVIHSAISFAFELIFPRISRKVENGDLEVRLINDDLVSSVSSTLSKIFSIKSSYSIVSEMCENYYANLYSNLHFCASLIPSNENEYKKLRNKRGEAFTCVRDFLFGIVRSSSLALSEVIPFTDHRLSDRIKVLRLGKECANNLMCLFGYSTEEMINSVDFASLPELYSKIDTNLRSFA